MNDMFLEDKEISLIAIFIGIITFDWLDDEFLFTHLPFNMGKMYSAGKVLTNMFDFVSSPDLIADAYSNMVSQNLVESLSNSLGYLGFLVCMSVYCFIVIAIYLQRIEYDNRLIEWGVNFALGHVMMINVNFVCNYFMLLAIIIGGETCVAKQILHNTINYYQ